MLKRVAHDRIRAITKVLHHLAIALAQWVECDLCVLLCTILGMWASLSRLLPAGGWPSGGWPACVLETQCIESQRTA